MKIIIFSLLLLSIYCALAPKVWYYRREAPLKQKKEIFKELGYYYFQAKNQFCKKILRPNILYNNITVNNITKFKLNTAKNNELIFYRKCLSKEEETKMLFEKGYVCLQRRETVNNKDLFDPIKCEQIKYNLTCCSSFISSECKQYYDEFSNYKCAYCYNNGKQFPCAGVLDEYIDLYYNFLQPKKNK